MTHAPKWIWVTAYHSDEHNDFFATVTDAETEENAEFPGEIKYVRADELDRLRVALRDCADDLEAEINAKYQAANRAYPSEERRFQRDMETVRQARAELARGKPSSGPAR